MIQLHDDLLAALDAVDIASPNRYVVLGEARDILDEATGLPLSDDDPDRLAAALAADLYRRLYIRPSPLSPPPRADLLSSRDLIAAMSRANTGTGTWERGWIARRIDEDGNVVVARDGVSYWADASQVRPRGGSIGEGEPCRVRMPKELRELVWGFYMAIGDCEDEDRDAEAEQPAIDRYYWHLSLSAAVPFLAAATSRLNASRVPFRLKVVNEPRAYRRADAGVLYIRRCDRRRVGAIIADLHSSIAHALGEEVPMFTKRLATGLGFAEDTAGELSFGQHRCRVVARALWRSFLRGDRNREARAQALASAFLEEGLDPARPHLSPGLREEDDTELEFSKAADTQANSAGAMGSRPAVVSTTPSMLEAAARIGVALCESAYWHRDGRSCNWMGRSNSEFTATNGPIYPTSAALGPDWYDGSAGIAAFLSQLCAQTGEAEFGRTARGAIANAIRQCSGPRAIRGSSLLSFFCGDLGVAFAAWLVGDRGDRREFEVEVGSILGRVARSLAEPHLLELIGGSAGAIPALVAMGRVPVLEASRDLAIALGEELGRTAIRRDATCAWDPEAASGPGASSLPMTGLSHGAAGIGLALLELYAESGRADFLELARGAFAYEDSYFNPHEGNWRDLRRSAPDPPYCRAWCHGAPGIALSRLRAAAIDPARGDAYLAAARTGMATTVAAIEENLALSRYDATPCNGITGLIEIASIAHRVLGESSYHDVAMEAARTLIARHSASGDWPSGVPSGGPNPSLMLGTAGIGYTLLRLHDPERVPSILWIGC